MAEDDSGGVFSGVTQGSAGSGLIGGILDSGLGFLASRRQYQRTKKMFKNRYQWTAADLEAAGLNRILALTKGPGAGSNVAQANVQGIGRGTALLAAQLQQIRATTAKTMTEERLLRAGVPTAEVKEETLRWFWHQARKLIKSSAKDLLSPEAKEAFGMSPAEKYGPIKVVPKGQKYRGEK